METGLGISGKSSWPELVGVKGEVAAAVIKSENPKLSTVIVKEGMFVTTDYRTDRVRIWVDNNGIVNSTPRIG